MPEERCENERGDAPPTQVLPPQEVVAFIVWRVAPPEFVLTKGIITPIEESLP